jgi:hypothetical protein
VDEKIKYLSIGFGIGLFLCALLLGILGKNKSIQEISIPIIGTIKFLDKTQDRKQMPVYLSVSGEVRDIFDNPRKDVAVILKGEGILSVTDGEGRFFFSEIPEQEQLDLEARYGAERSSVSIVLERDAAIVKNTIIEDSIHHSYSLHRPLVLENPEIRVEALLCENITDHSPQAVFTGENPSISADVNAVWCFIRVFGPLDYERGKKTILHCDWYLDRDHLYRHTIQVGFNPTPQGWRTHVYKNVNQQVGQWRIEIKATHKTLATLYFELR